MLVRSIDDVYNYLDAINKQTLGRIEEDTKAIRTSLTNLGDGMGNQLNVIKNEVIKTQQIATAIETRLKIELPGILTEVKNVFSLVGAIRESVLLRIESAIAAIKAKTDRLP